MTSAGMHARRWVPEAAVAGLRAGNKRGRSAFQAAHMDQSVGGPRPQDAFDPPPDNSNTPFQPRLAHWQGFLVSTPLRSAVWLPLLRLNPADDTGACCTP